MKGTALLALVRSIQRVLFGVLGVACILTLTACQGSWQRPGDPVPDPTISPIAIVSAGSRLTPTPDAAVTTVTMAPATPDAAAALPLIPRTQAGRPAVQPASPQRTEQADPLAANAAGSSPVALSLNETLAAASAAAQDGDYSAAIALWEGVIGALPAEQRGETTLSLARAYIAEKRHRDALNVLAGLVAGSLPDDQRALAVGLLGTCHEALGEWGQAASAYEQYLALDDAAAPEVRWRIAQAYAAQEDYAAAAQQLETITLDGLPAAQQAEILEELAQDRRALHDYDAALRIYDRILGIATKANYRAAVQHYQAETLREAGREDEAVAIWREIAANQPETQAAYGAFLALEPQHADALDDLTRGVILYHAGQYQVALDVLARYLAADAPGDPAKAHYYAGLAYQFLERYSEAFGEFDAAIAIAENDPQSALLAEAWVATARAAAEYGGDPSGLYREFWVRYPDHPRAAEALWRAAVAREREGDWAGAAEFYALVRERYPADSRASEAAFREGLAAYARNDAATARTLWENALPDVNAGEKPRRLLWVGLAARAAGDADAAASYWQQASEAEPWGYYGLRARDLRAGVGFALPIETFPHVAAAQFTEDDWNAINAWMTTWGQTASPNESLLHRGAALWRLGWRDEALAALRGLRSDWADDPASLLALLRQCNNLGVHSVAISCAERLWALGQAAGAGDPPRALLRLAYPAWWGDLVSREADAYALDPLLFLALVRQESRFDPLAI